MADSQEKAIHEGLPPPQHSLLNIIKMKLHLKVNPHSVPVLTTIITEEAETPKN